MNATTSTRPLMFVLFLAAAGILVALAVPTIMECLADLPMTQHAETSHSEQTWNAVTIRDYMDAGKCKPTQYACPDQDFDVNYCEVKAGLSIGIVIGRTIEQIITGYAANTNHWANRCP